MIALKKNWLRFVLFFAVGLSLSFITAQAPTPELSTNLFFSLPAFFIFLLFVVAIFSWGSFIRAQVRYEFALFEAALFDLSIGSTFAYLAAYTLTTVGLFSSNHAALLWGVLAAGFALGKPDFSFITVSITRFSSKWFRFLAMIPWLILILKLIEALQFHQHGDGYITYLPAPRIWATSGSFESYLRYTQFFLSTSWEALFAWGTALMHLTQGNGLDLSQWFSQWVTAGIGTLGIILGLLSLADRINSSPYLSLAIIVGLQVPTLRWTANLAKNDFGIAFWGIAFFYFVQYFAPQSSGFAFLTGVLAGSMVIGKLTLVVFGVIFSAQLAFLAPKRILPYLAGGIVGVAPILVRNFTLTHNPLFPWLSEFFHTSHLLGLSESIGSARATQVVLTPSLFLGYFSEIYFQIPLCFILIWALFYRPEAKQARRVLLGLFATLIVFTFTLRTATEIRYQGATLMLLAFFSVHYWFIAFDVWMRKAPHLKNAVAALSAIALLATSDISLHTLIQVFGKKYGTWSERMTGMIEIGGPGKTWIRTHLKPTDSILVVGDGYVYYLSDYTTMGYGQNRDYEKLVADQDAEGAALAFKNAPFDYLYIAREADYVVYRPTLVRVMEITQKWPKSCQIYHETTGQVWDLRCLKTNAHLK